MTNPTLSVFSRIELIQGDITHQQVDAIVNAANTSLMGGGGVDGAIHRAAGPGLLEECRQIGGCPTGEARITSGYQLPARWVIHTVGPVWQGGASGEAEALANCYRNVFAIAANSAYEIRTVALPGISIGVFGYPIPEATVIALGEALAFLRHNQSVDLIRFVLYGRETLNIHRSTLTALEQSGAS